MEVTVSLAVKLGSIIVHLAEFARPDGHPFDLHSATTLMEDPEVIEFMAGLEARALVPVPRDGVTFS